MEIRSTTLEGVHLIASKLLGDERGYLSRMYCEKTFRDAGLCTQWVQTSITYSAQVKTLRGMHFQKEPHGEIKLIRCLTGKVWDCLIDLRKNSASYGKWEAFELSEENAHALYVPAGIAHGFFTLTSDVRMHYSMSTPFSAEHASGVRWNDAAFQIAWPDVPEVISQKDQTWDLI